jgi:hypothetical protein
MTVQLTPTRQVIAHAPAAVADAFCASRLGPASPGVFGTLPSGADAAAIVERHTPVLTRLPLSQAADDPHCWRAPGSVMCPPR